MANIKSSKKRAKQNIKKRAINLSRRSLIKSSIKKVIVALENSKPESEVKELFNSAQAILARASGKGLLHKKNASRKVSRLSKKIKDNFQNKKS